MLDGLILFFNTLLRYSLFQGNQGFNRKFTKADAMHCMILNIRLASLTGC